MIKAIFYSKFDTQEGPKVVHQVPNGAIVPSPTAPGQPLFLPFPDISFFVIPRQELCGNLIQVCINGYRILGYPICMKSTRYDRNEFIFNFCVVLPEEEEFNIYKSVVQKLADIMHGLEEQNQFLSRDNSKSGEGKVYSLCETLMEDLNNYCECMIPIDDLNTLNIKLFPVYPAPPPVKAWQVPLFTVRYQAFMDENWDLTMQRVVPHINGVNSIRIISILSDTDFSLACRAIRHLLYYGCLVLLDIFSFSAIYALTAQFSSTFASDKDMQEECARYVTTVFDSTVGNASTAGGASEIASTASGSHSPRSPSLTTTVTSTHSASANATLPSTMATGTEDSQALERDTVDSVGLIELYASLKQGQSVKQWYILHSRQLAHIDIRRFITFGIIKGFLYRIHKYAVATGLPAPPMKSFAPHNNYHPHSSQPPSGVSSRGPGTGTNTPYASSVGEESAPIASLGPTPNGSRPGTVVIDDDDFIDDKSLSKYLDGMHCFDQICTELEISERELTTRLKRYSGEVLIIHR